MDWTKETPVKPGYYWIRKNKYKFSNMICVWIAHEESIAQENLDRSINKQEEISRYESINVVKPHNLIFYVRYVGEHLSDKQTLIDMPEREWYGPLVAPDYQEG